MTSEFKSVSTEISKQFGEAIKRVFEILYMLTVFPEDLTFTNPLSLWNANDTMK